MSKYEEIRRVLNDADKKAGTDSTDFWRCGFHLTPPAGWLNDPNGLCQFQGYYHIFFQYAPAYPANGAKGWGHYRSRDLIKWEYLGLALYPDTDLDKDGAYSGSALIENDTMYLFYTGNVKEPGEHDFTHSGRQSNTILVESRDGIHFSEKKCVLDNSGYPSDYTCHIRDPKVSGKDGRYDMVLGGRKKGDRGAVLVYESENRENWKLVCELTTDKPFGYMWECPDIFQIGGQNYLSICPQGLPAEEYRFQNIHQSGYFILTPERTLENFVEWDMGFDFYAPQIFTDDRGRRILIGWAGLPDEPYQNPDLEKGWTQALTVPRILTRTPEGLLRQYPAEELDRLQGRKAVWTAMEDSERAGMEFNGIQKTKIQARGYDWQLTKTKEQKLILWPAEGLELKITEREVVLQFQSIGSDIPFPQQEYRSVAAATPGAGRTCRKALHSGINAVRILADGSVLEIYLNYGELVMTTRIYQKRPGFEVEAAGSVDINVLYEMNC